MADFEGAKIIRTHRDNETKIILVDGASGASATKSMTITEEGVAYVGGTNDFGVVCMGKDATGESIIIPIPLPITDNGGSITVDGTVAISGSVTVTATNLDIRDLTHASDSVKVGDGTDFLAINTDGSINVKAAEVSGKVSDYKTTATVGVGSAILHFYVVTDTKTFIGKKLLVGAKGGVKVRFGYSADGLALTTVKGCYFQNPKENIDHSLEMLQLLGDATAAFCVEITNTDGTSSDVYSLLQGYEV